MNISKIREVKTPSRGTEESAGIDLFIPTFDDKFIEDFDNLNVNPRSMCYLDRKRNNIWIHPHGQCMVPTGIRAEIPKGFAWIGFNKGGVSWKDRVSALACVIDSDYQSEIFITVQNYSDYPTVVLQGQKLLQFVLLPVQYDNITIIEDSEIHKEKSERSGGLGSTGIM